MEIDRVKELVLQRNYEELLQNDQLMKAREQVLMGFLLVFETFYTHVSLVREEYMLGRS